MRAVPTVGSAARPVAMLAVVLSLGACVSSPDPSAVASIDECRIETRRELQHVGPPGKSPPAPVTRRVRVCQPAWASPDRILMSR